MTRERLLEFSGRLQALLEEFWPIPGSDPPADGTSLRFGGFVYRDTDLFYADEENPSDSPPS
jgi:hypothetical protein